MANVVRLHQGEDDQPAKLSVHDAQRIVRTVAQESKNVFVVDHAKKRQKKRSISFRQIMSCLQKGIVTEGPFINIHGNWQVNVSRLAAGEQVTCTVAIEWQRQLVVVTVYPG